MVEQIKQLPIYVLELEESTDVSSCAQLMVNVRYIHDYDFKEESQEELLSLPKHLFRDGCSPKEFTVPH